MLNYVELQEDNLTRTNNLLSFGHRQWNMQNAEKMNKDVTSTPAISFRRSMSTENIFIRMHI